MKRQGPGGAGASEPGTAGKNSPFEAGDCGEERPRGKEPPSRLPAGNLDNGSSEVSRDIPCRLQPAAESLARIAVRRRRR